MPIVTPARAMPMVRTMSPSHHFRAAKTGSTRDRTRARVALPRAILRRGAAARPWPDPTATALLPDELCRRLGDEVDQAAW
jgi:hypothetical protein